MQGQRSNGEAYYRCRYVQEYALANQINHPRNILPTRTRPRHTPRPRTRVRVHTRSHQDTVTRLADSQHPPATYHHTTQQVNAQLARCDKKLASYRAALDAGAGATVVTAWITEIQNERRTLQQRLTTAQPEPRQRLTRDQISTLVQQVGELTTALAEADPTDRSEVYRQLGLKLTYHPEQQSPRTGTA